MSRTVPIGPTTILGALVAVLAASGATLAAIRERDTIAVASTVAALVTAVTVLAGRYAQAVAAARADDGRVDPGEMIDALIDLDAEGAAVEHANDPSLHDADDGGREGAYVVRDAAARPPVVQPSQDPLGGAWDVPDGTDLDEEAIR